MQSFFAEKRRDKPVESGDREKGRMGEQCTHEPLRHYAFATFFTSSIAYNTYYISIHSIVNNQ
jgi:hypothetical protein